MAKKGNSSAAAPSSSKSSGSSSSKSSGSSSLQTVGSNLSKKEAVRIADQKGKSVSSVMNKAMNKGLTIGSALVNAYNRGDYTSSRDRLWNSVGQGTFGTKGFNSLTGVSNNMAGLAGLKLNSGQVYGGSYMRDGQLTPLVGLKGVGTGGGKNSNTVPSAPSNGETTPGVEDPLFMDFELPEMKEKEMVNNSFSPGGAGEMLDGSATSFRRKRSSARTAGLTSKGTSQFKISGQSGRSSGLNIGV